MVFIKIEDRVLEVDGSNSQNIIYEVKLEQLESRRIDARAPYETKIDQK